jgi:abequosyltransferase
MTPPAPFPTTGIRLSICIATFKRADYIDQTLESIVGQLTDATELIVLDGASPDQTQVVASRFAATNPTVRYIRETTNSGIDKDYDKAVGHARGEYCWLMSDDDLLAPHAVERVLRELDSVVDLVVVNAKVMDAALEHELRPRMLRIESDQRWSVGSAEQLFSTVGDYLSFIGAVVVRRACWLARPREPYYGTLFVHVGTLFQVPAVERAVAIAEPLIVIRYGNAMWTARGFEIWMFKWPRLVWSFAHFSEQARAQVSNAYPFRDLRRLLFLRAVGSYSIAEYRGYLQALPFHVTKPLQSLIARLPGRWANALCGAYYALRPGKSAGMELYDLARATHASPFTQRVAAARRSAE